MILMSSNSTNKGDETEDLVEHISSHATQKLVDKESEIQEKEWPRKRTY